MDAIPIEPSPLTGAHARRDLRRVGAHPDHWYPLAWSREVKAGRAFAARFAGEPIVLVRTRDNELFALEDRCAHRQVPLHLGVVEGACVKCCYHGWRYDRSGHCVDVPYLGREKLPNGVRAYPCQEKAGLIFVFPGDVALADEQPLPDLAAATDPAYKTRRFGREVRCHYSFMHENLMDMNHQFLHRRLMGQIRPHYRGRRLGDTWLEVDYTFARTAGRQPLGEAAIFGQRRAQGQGNDGDLMTIRTGYPHQSLWIRTGSAAPVMDLWISYVPMDAGQRTNRVFGLLSVRRPRLPGLLDVAWPLLVWFTESIFREDRHIVELEQRAHDQQGEDRNQEVFPVIRDLRTLLGNCGAPGEITV
jgi:phenylpropionate dioxygenase-like ring-hydroxylating dioxygenase large terminal subunit